MVKKQLFVTMVSSSQCTAQNSTDSISSATGDGNIQQGSRGVSPRLARVTSGYIRKLNEQKLLIPGKNIHLQDTVGQGKYIWMYKNIFFRYYIWF